MNVKLKKIQVNRPSVKIIAGIKTINGNAPIDQIIGTAGYATLDLNGVVSDNIGNATLEE